MSKSLESFKTDSFVRNCDVSIFFVNFDHSHDLLVLSNKNSDFVCYIRLFVQLSVVGFV